MKFKGTVIELNPKTAVVMTSECDFVRVRRREGMEPGREYTFSRRDVFEANRRPGRLTIALAACLLLFMLCIPVYTSFFIKDAGATVAYVSMDINPSLELAVNNRYLVTDAEAFNEDGENLLKNVPVNGKTIEQAILALLNAAEELNYLPGSGNDTVLICVSSIGSNQSPPAELVSSINAGMSAKKPGDAEVKVIQSSGNQHREAAQMGMSAGRYAVWQDAGTGDTSKLEHFKNGRLNEIMSVLRGNGKSNNNGNNNGNGNGNGNGHSNKNDHKSKETPKPNEKPANGKASGFQKESGPKNKVPPAHSNSVQNSGPPMEKKFPHFPGQAEDGVTEDINNRPVDNMQKSNAKQNNGEAPPSPPKEPNNKGANSGNGHNQNNKATNNTKNN